MGGAHDEADADVCLLDIFGELLQVHRRSAFEIDRKSNRRITHPGPPDLLKRTRQVSLDIAPNIRHDDADTCRAPKEIDRPDISGKTEC